MLALDDALDERSAPGTCFALFAVDGQASGNRDPRASPEVCAQEPMRRVHQPAPQLDIDRVDRGSRVEALGVQDFALVDIADPTADPLVEQGNGNRRAGLSHAEASGGGIEIGFWTGEIGAEVCRPRPTPNQFDHRRIETDPEPSLGRLDQRSHPTARALPLLTRSVEVPTARHLHVRLERGPIAKVHQQVFALGFDLIDGRTDRWPGSDETRCLEPGDGLTGKGRSQTAGRPPNGVSLRHLRSVAPASVPSVNQAQDSAATSDLPWWKTDVVYQVYIRSFADGNGDGTGDIAGLRARLPYLRDLGVDAIWLNPWYKSPLHDGGYDVADYRNIEPRYGSLEEAEALITDAHAHGIKIVTDLVPNHTSSEHAWFQEAQAAEPGSPARNRYHIRPGKGPDGAEPPTNWTSVFGGSAWERLPDGEWFLHIFDHTQPDLNWTNPEVIEEFKSIFRFWLDRGVDGFRVDVAHGLAKDMNFPDVDENPVLLANANTPDHPFWDRDELHSIVRGWRSVLDEYDQTMMVAEAWVAADRLPLYIRPDEYHQSFNFDFLTAPWDAARMQDVLSKSIDAAEAVGAAPTWVLSNHDVVRHTTRYGLPNGTDWRSWLLDGPHDALDAELGLTRARAGVMMMLGLPGGVYLYQGEELGLPEVWDLPVEVLDDPVWEQSNRKTKGRDGCRVPVPWTADGPSFGFGENAGWLPQPDVFGALSAEAQTGQEGSTLELYRSALAVRKDHFVNDSDIEWLDSPNGVIGLRRGSGAECWLNVSGEPLVLDPTRTVLLCSGELVDGALPVNTAVWLA